MSKGKRFELRKRFTSDTKYLYHIARLLLQVEQIMAEGDLDLQRHREQLKSIRRGEWTIQQVKDWAATKEKQLEQLYHDSKLRHTPDEPAIRQLLLDCLETHYGSLADAVVDPDAATTALRQIKEIIDRTKV